MSRLQRIKAAQMLEDVNPYGPPQAVGVDHPVHAQPKAPAAMPNRLDHYQAAMDADLATLSQIKDLAEKAKAKQGMIKTYWPLVESYLANGDNYPNAIVVRVCIWLFDTLDIERGLNLAFVLIQQNQPTPPKFDRDLKTFVCDALYDWANALLQRGESVSPYLDSLAAKMTTERWDVHPAVASKIYAMLAKHKLREGDYKTAVALCDVAERINPDGAGVKTLRKTAVSKLEKP